MLIKKSLGAARRALYNARDRVLYERWIEQFETATRSSDYRWQPLISIVVPTYNPDPSFFRAMVASVLNQTYGNWELILVDDKSTDNYVREMISDFVSDDPRIKCIFLDKNQHIARATNVGIKSAKGIYVGLLDHDDILHEGALAEVVQCLNKNKNLEFIYTDEDRIIGKRRAQPIFKPDLNIDMLHAVNYITHFAVVCKTTLDRVGYERHEYNGAQDWELFLRIVRAVPSKNIYHIPKVLYSWRVHELSTSKDMAVKPYVLEAQKKAIEDDLHDRGAVEYILKLDDKYSGQWRVSYNASKEEKILYVGEGENINYQKLQKYELVAFVKGTLTPQVRHMVQRMASDALRDDIGIVVTGKDRVVWNNLIALIGEERATLIYNFTHISVAKHLYRTVRYNIEDIYDYDMAVLETSKVKRGMDTYIVNKELTSNNLRHLYIPYRDLV